MSKKTKVVKAWTIVNQYGPVFANIEKQQVEVYGLRKAAKKHGRPFKWEKVVPCTITYKLPPDQN